MKVKELIIKIKREKDSEKKVEKIIKELKVKEEVIEEVDRSEIKKEEIERIYKRRMKNKRYKFEIRRKEIECLMQKRKEWKEIIERKIDEGLIVEEDIEMKEKLMGE